jgi:acyl transferase domain-containing protein
MSKPVIWMFSGQGSQYFQMGAELFASEAVFREQFERGSDLVKSLVNESLVDVVYGPRPNRFESFQRTLLTHPAIFLVEWSLAQLLLSKGLKPDRLMGYSVGEFASFAIAGSLSFEDALVTLVKQAEVMEYCTPRVGVMAVLESPEIIERFASEFFESEMVCRTVDKGFIVVSSPARHGTLQTFLKSKAVNFMDLPIAHGFHARWMDWIEKPFHSVLNKLAVNPPRLPLISAAIGPLPSPSSAHLWTATRARVDFRGTISDLERSGSHLYLDVGPSGTMATLVKHNLTRESKSEYASILSPFGRSKESLAKAMEIARR